MSNGDGEKIVISSQEVGAFQGTSSERPRGIPLWAATLVSLTVLCLPLLCLCAIAIRAFCRNEPRARDAWSRFLCTLLIVSGLLTSVSFGYLLSRGGGPAAPLAAASLRPLRLSHPFPHFPSAEPLNARQIAEEASQSVYIVAPESAFAGREGYIENAPIGSATLLMSDASGYLLTTSRHVVDAEIGFGWKRQASEVALYSRERGYATAEVVGRHRAVDLALIRARSAGSALAFVQPVRRASDPASGEQVFVIGHPHRLFFTLSSGLVSRTEDRELLQFSAPVSPGNSGGPVYDSNGYLLGVVASMVDRGINPNAENLNFAVRAKNLLETTEWSFTGEGKAQLEKFISSQQRPVH